MATDDILTTNPIRFSAFGTLAVTSAGNDKLGFNRELSQNIQTNDLSLTSDSVLGAQIDWNITPKLSANLQVVIKDRINNGLEESVEWANIKYNINEDLDIRIGRLGADIYMLSEYRNTSYAYLWARPITDFYKAGVFSNFDGADIAYTKRLDDGLLQFKLFGGKAHADISNLSSYTRMDLENFVGFNALFENQTWKIRIGASTTTIKDIDDPISTLRPVLDSIPNVLWPDIDKINEKTKYIDNRFAYYSVGFSYETDWIIQSEFAYLDSEFEFFPSSYSGYISIGKHFNQLTPYIVFSKIKVIDDPYQVGAPNPGFGIEQLQHVVQGIFNQVQFDQQTISLGMRWDLIPKMALKAQWDHTRINDHKTALWTQFKYPNDESSMDTISISLDFIF